MDLCLAGGFSPISVKVINPRFALFILQKAFGFAKMSKLAQLEKAFA